MTRTQAAHLHKVHAPVPKGLSPDSTWHLAIARLRSTTAARPDQAAGLFEGSQG